MKTMYKVLTLVILLSGCVSNRYLLTDNGKDSKFLIEKIKEAQRTGDISKKPIIVVDGIPHRFDKELKQNRLQLAKKDIKQVDVLKKEMGLKIYGEAAKDGVLLITTKASAKQGSEPIVSTKVLILLEDREISKSEMDKINPNDIESIDVIKDSDKVKQYTTGDYDGVVIIHMKKPN